MDHQKKALWTQEEDRVLTEYVREHGRGKWNRIAELTGLKRGGKSCRLRWLNYLSPNVKRGDFSEEEEDLIIRLHSLIGNRWSLIAGRVPGRTDNQVKNYWNTHLCKKLGLKKQARKTAMSSKPQTSNKMEGVHKPANNSELLKRSQDSEILRNNDPSSFSVGEIFHDAREAHLQGNPETSLFYDLFNWNSPAGLMDFLD